MAWDILFQNSKMSTGTSQTSLEPRPQTEFSHSPRPTNPGLGT